MDWERVKYIFQIPVSWYKKIDDWVFNAYGTNFIRVKAGDWYGGMEITVDEDEFQQAVDRSLGGIVRSVNNTAPDANGNVNVGTVRAVNNTGPDANGNVTIQTGTGTVKSVDSVSPDSNGNVNLDAVTNSSLSTTLQNYVTNSSLSTTLQGYVTSVHLFNTLLEYATIGWVETQGYLTSADLSSYVTNTSLTTTLQDYVTNSSLQTTLQNYVTQQDFTTLENAVDELGDDVTDLSTDVELLKLDCVKSVDGHTPTNGAVSFGLTANKWLKSDSSGHITTTNDEPLVPSTSSSGYIYNNNGNVSYTSLTANKWVKTTANGLLTTTDDVPVTVNPQSSGYLYNNAGTLQYKDDEYVTLATQQIITGAKTFNGSGDMILMTGGGTIGMIGGTNQHVRMSLDGLQMVQGLSVTLGLGTTTTAFGDMPHINFWNGGYQASIYRGSGSDGISSNLHISDEQGIVIHAPANQATLTNHPTDTSTSSKAIATVGYCQDHFGGSGGGTVKSVDHVSPDAQGNVQLNAIRTINGHNGDSVGNFAGVVTSINGNTPTDGAVTMTVVQSVDGVSPDANGAVTLNAVKTVNSISPDASGNVDIDAVKSVDGHQPDQNGAVSFGLTASKWVKTNSSGHLTTTNDTPVTLPSGTTGQTYSVNLVTGVTWNGTQLVVAKETFTFTNGVLTSHVTAQSTTIDTTPYSPT